MNVVFYHPTSEEGKQQLAKSVAEIHANAVNARIKERTCPTPQKLQLLDAVVGTTLMDQYAMTRANSMLSSINCYLSFVGCTDCQSRVL